jgi:hypothetical protein
LNISSNLLIALADMNIVVVLLVLVPFPRGAV